MLEEILFEDGNNQGWDFENDPNHPLNKDNAPTQIQRPQGAAQPQQIGNGQNSIAQRVAGLQKQNRVADSRDAIRQTNEASMEQFMGTLEVNMTNIERVAGRTTQVQQPRQHFVAHMEILASMDNVYRALDKVATTPAVKKTCMALQADLNGAIKTLKNATRGVQAPARQ